MKSGNKNITWMKSIRIVFGCSGLFCCLHVLLAIVEALVSAGLLALAVAGFVDKAMEILENGQGRSELYIPLLRLLIFFGLFISLGTVINLVDARIKKDVNCKIKPIMTKTQAQFEYRHIENDKDWELISRVTRDPATSLVDGFAAYILVMQIVISIFSVLGLLITQVWWAVFVIVAFSGPLFYLSIRAGKINYKAEQDVERYNRRTEYFGGLLIGRDNIEERTLFSYGKEISQQWFDQYEKARKKQLKVALRQFLTMKGSSMILVLISLLIAMTLLNPVVTGKLSVGLFTGIVSSIFAIINRLAGQMSSSMERISRINEYLKDYDAFFELSKMEGALEKPQESTPEFEKLEFRDVSFRYATQEEYTLRHVSFTLKKGKHYAFVGKNGAGKSTIIKLLTGLYQDYEGEILLNGKELREYGTPELKAFLSVVYQDFAKYAISIRENIALGDVAHLGEVNVESIVNDAGISDIVAGMKEGLDAKLGKIDAQGQELSGGQWQRIAIARSLISKAPVRILDEPTAALDPIRESQIYQEFEKLMRDKTTIFISHRLGSTKLSDEILVVDGGMIAEQGTHDELMRKEGLYAEMYESQRSWYR